MSALATRLSTPPAALLRHQSLEPSEWWRCRATIAGRDAWGTVTGLIQLGPMVTSYQVRLDDGTTIHAWPSAVGRVPVPAPAPTRFTLLEGGRVCV